MRARISFRNTNKEESKGQRLTGVRIPFRKTYKEERLSRTERLYRYLKGFYRDLESSFVDFCVKKTLVQIEVYYVICDIYIIMLGIFFTLHLYGDNLRVVLPTLMLMLFQMPFVYFRLDLALKHGQAFFWRRLFSKFWYGLLITLVAIIYQFLALNCFSVDHALYIISVSDFKYRPDIFYSDCCIVCIAATFIRYGLIAFRELISDVDSGLEFIAFLCPFFLILLLFLLSLSKALPVLVVVIPKALYYIACMQINYSLFFFVSFYICFWGEGALLLFVIFCISF